jgi:cell division protein FtsB
MALAGILMVFLPKVKQMQAYQETSDELQQQIDRTLAQEKELKTKQQRFLSEPYYVEKIAHEVGYAYPNEVIFQFMEEDTQTNDSGL